MAWYGMVWHEHGMAWAWAWAEVDRVRSGAQVIVGWGNPRKLCGAGPPSAHYTELWGSPLLSSLPLFPLSPSTTIDLSSQNMKWQEGGGMHLVTLKGRIQSRYKLFNCLLLTPWLTSWLYFFPQKSVLFTPAITTQQQRSPKTSKDISTCKILLFKGAHWILHITNYEVQALILFLADQLFHSKTFCECLFSSRLSADKATNRL